MDIIFVFKNINSRSDVILEMKCFPWLHAGRPSYGERSAVLSRNLREWGIKNCTLLKLHDILSVDYQETHSNYGHQMSHFKAEMHQIRFRRRLRPSIPQAELTVAYNSPASPKPSFLVGFAGLPWVRGSPWGSPWVWVRGGYGDCDTSPWVLWGFCGEFGERKTRR